MCDSCCDLSQIFFLKKGEATERTRKLNSDCVFGATKEITLVFLHGIVLCGVEGDGISKSSYLLKILKEMI